LGEADPAKKEESPDNHLTVGEKRSLHSNVLQDTLGTGTLLAGAEGIFGPEIVGILWRNKVYPTVTAQPESSTPNSRQTSK